MVMGSHNPPKRLREESMGVARRGPKWKVKAAASLGFDPEVFVEDYLGQITTTQGTMEGSRNGGNAEVQGVQMEIRERKHRVQCTQQMTASMGTEKL